MFNKTRVTSKAKTLTAAEFRDGGCRGFPLARRLRSELFSCSLFSIGACGGRGSGCRDAGSESTDNQTRGALMSPKRQTCSLGKAARLCGEQK